MAEKVKYNCSFAMSGDYSKFKFRVIDFVLNGKYYNCASQNIYNDWIDIYFNQPLNIEEIKYSEVEMEFVDGILIINGNKYLVNSDEFLYFVQDIGANFEDSIEDVMLNFCNYLIENISDL